MESNDSDQKSSVEGGVSFPDHCVQTSERNSGLIQAPRTESSARGFDSRLLVTNQSCRQEYDEWDDFPLFI